MALGILPSVFLAPSVIFVASLEREAMMSSLIGRLVGLFWQMALQRTIVPERGPLDGFYLDSADTSKKADDGQKGVSCPSEGSSAKSSSATLCV